ncbi:MAG: hypothetical protein MI975_09140 [Cytophagales bacterium]|nr:hypothetical protein [Cytophagales bacterium]
MAYHQVVMVVLRMSEAEFYGTSMKDISRKIRDFPTCPGINRPDTENINPAWPWKFTHDFWIKSYKVVGSQNMAFGFVNQGLNL